MNNPSTEYINSLNDIFSRSRIIELSHLLVEGIPTYPTHTKYFQNAWKSKGDIALMNQLVIGEHTGTHVDSPSHFPVLGTFASQSIDQVSIQKLMGRCVKITIDPPLGSNQMVPESAILAWEMEHGNLQPGDIVLLDLQWSNGRWDVGEPGFAFLEDWPGLSLEAAHLLKNRKVSAVGTDCMSLDTGDGGRGSLPAHFELLSAGILIMENVFNLDILPTFSFFMALPLRIGGGTGSPIRAVAFVGGDSL